MDLDLTCTARLEVYDLEREKRQLEAMSGGLLANAFGGTTGPQIDRGNPIALDA